MSSAATSSMELIGKWRFPATKFSYEKEVLIRQTNLMGNTYFANYIEWQGEAREKFFLAHPAASEFLKQNPDLVLVTYCLYHRFIENSFFGDRIRIDITTREIKKYDLIVVFRYYNVKTESLIGEGWQKICFSDRNTNQLSPVPQIFLDLAEPVREAALTDHD